MLVLLRGIGMMVVTATSRMLLLMKMRPVASLVRMMLLLLVWGMMPSGTVIVMSWIAAAM
jgi:hypothetical protein